jgi:enamine deaminase RidA (YjgF/YER057c/UK114 family)
VNEPRSAATGELPVSVSVSRFCGQGGVEEYHLVARPTACGNIGTQLEWVSGAYRQTLEDLGLDAQTAVFKRFFCSDLANQAAALEACPISNPHRLDEPCAVSWSGQSPMSPAKVALWAYHFNDAGRNLEKCREGACLTLRRNGLRHHWTTGIACPNGDTSYDQTRGIFDKYDSFLKERNLSLADSVLRTWLFVEDIDSNYQEVVAARREVFAERGLTRDTHFIASTGIEGASVDAGAKITMDAYAISGVRREQVEYLAALDHLSPTHVYGVTFERGTSVSYRDRKHIIISGTASIDDTGEILYEGDVPRQLERTLENVEALLEQAGATLEDMCVFVVYVRDPADHVLVWKLMRDRFGQAPIEVVLAPVCRPGWLVEVEGMAILPSSNPGLPPL